MTVPEGVVGDVRSYYRAVSRFIDLELDARGDAAFWRQVAREAPDASILELGAGTGRITRHLAGGARHVVALDVSMEMLRRIPDHLDRRHGVSLLAADMRRVPLEARFDLIVAANDPFVHLLGDEDRDRAVREVAAHLHPGGRFYLDAHWIRPEALARAAEPGGLVRERPVGEADAGITVREAWWCDAETSLCTARYEYFRGGTRVEEASFRARLWTVSEVKERMGAAGLRLRSVWGDFDRAPWDPETAPHLVVEAVRDDDRNENDDEERS